MASRKIWTIPNLITIFRILLTPWFVIAFLNQSFQTALLIFVVAGLSDGVDGFLARMLNQRSEFGAMIDPLADKILLITSFLCLSAFGLVSSWLAVLVISRDLIIMGGLALLKFYGIEVEKRISPLWTSKITTALQILVIFLILFRLSFGYDLQLYTALEVVTALFTIVSGSIYVRRGMVMFDEIETK